jgi:hypothetical protein
MNAALMRGLVPDNYAQQGSEALAKRQKQITSLLSERRLPAHGWDTASIERLLQVASSHCYSPHAECPRLSAVVTSEFDFSWDNRMSRQWTPTTF